MPETAVPKKLKKPSRVVHRLSKPEVQQELIQLMAATIGKPVAGRANAD